MNEVEPRVVGPRGHGVGQREKTSSRVCKIVQRIEIDPQASPSISRSPKKINFSAGASTSKMKKNKSKEAPNIHESSLSIRTRSTYRKDKGKTKELKEEILEPQPSDNTDNVEETLHSPREGNSENPLEAVVEEVATKRRK